MFTPSNGPEMSSFISAAPVASGQVQSLDSLRGHSLPTDAMIVASATQVNPTNQNPGSYAIVESAGATALTNNVVAAVTQSPFADLYKEGSMYFPGATSSNIYASLGSSYSIGNGLTAECWVNYTSFAGSTFNLGSGGTSVYNPCALGAFSQTAGSCAWALGADTNGKLLFYYYSSSAGNQSANTNASLSLNTWNHIAVSIPSTGPISLYINGVQQTSNANNGGSLTAPSASTVALNGTTSSYNYLGVGGTVYYSGGLNAYTTGYIADARVVYGAALYTGSSFTVPSAPLSIATSGTTALLLRAGQNSPTIQSGALTFDRGLKQYMNFGPQTFNIVTQGFTAVWRGQFTGTVGSYERLFEFGTVSTNGCIYAFRTSTNSQVTFGIYPSTSSTTKYETGSITTINQGTTYIFTFRYSPVTQLLDVWVNGVFQASTAATTAQLVADRTLNTTYIGYPTNTPAFLNGTMNTFAVYNRALSNAEILTATQALNTVPATPQQKTLEIGDINGTPALSVAGNGQVSVQSIGLSSNVVPWPPAAMTGYVTSINGKNYVASASSDQYTGSVAYAGWTAFAKGASGALGWVTVSGTYNTSAPYGPTGPTTTVDVNGSSYPGEWLQIQIPSSIVLSNYQINTGGSSTSQRPSKWFLLGSRDGVNWFLIDSQNGVTLVTSTFVTFTVPVGQAFTYFRWVVNQLGGAPFCNGGQIVYYGTADTSPSLTIAPATTFNTSVATPSLTGIAASGVYAPQDFSSSGLNIPAYVVSNTATVANTVAFSSFGPFAGEGSFQFPGGTATGIVFPPSVTQVNPFTGGIPDFTFECWIYQTAATGSAGTGSGIIVNRGTITGYQDWVITTYNNSGTNILLFNMFQTGGGNTAAFGPTIPLNQWVHIAVTLRSGAGTAFVNGVAGTPTGSIGSMRYTSTSSTIIGNGPQPFNGYIAGMRMINGQALYVGNFTHSTQSLTAIQGTTQAGLPYGTVLLLRNAPAPGRIQTTRLTGSNSGGVNGAPLTLPFPPAAMTGYSTALNAGYGQGTYVASASSENTAGGGYQSYKAFDKATGNPYSSVGNLYNSSTGVYAGATSNATVDINGSSYIGEWLQIQLPVSIVLSNYQIQSRSDYGNNNGEPKTWWILGSRDGVAWNLVDSRTGVTFGGAGSNNSITVQSSQAFSYYRMVTYVIAAQVGAQNLAIGEWTLNGTLEAINITNDGRVGLGVVNPTRALEVAGDVVCGGTLSAGNPLMFRNAIYNGGMAINQRGFSTNWASPTAIGTSGTGQNYGLDRMNMARGSFASGGAFSQGTVATADLPYSQGIQYYLRLGRSSGNATADAVYFNQALETRESYKFAGQPVTLSLFYRTGAGFSGTGITLNITYGTGTDQNAVTGFTSAVTRTSPSFSASNAWQYATFTTFVPPTATQVATYVIYTPSGTAGGFDYFDVTGVQLEKGTVATPFEVRPYATELALCQRYYQKYGGTTAYERFGMGMWVFSNQAYITKPFIAPMRAAPTLVQTGSMRTYSNNLGYTAVTSVAIDQATTQGTNLSVSIAGTVFVAWPASLEASGDATATLQFSAEL